MAQGRKTERESVWARVCVCERVCLSEREREWASACVWVFEEWDNARRPNLGPLRPRNYRREFSRCCCCCCCCYCCCSKNMFILKKWLSHKPILARSRYLVLTTSRLFWIVFLIKFSRRFLSHWTLDKIKIYISLSRETTWEFLVLVAGLGH